MANKKRMYKKGSFPGMEPNKELTFGGMKYEDGGEYPVYKKSSDKAKSFREAFAAARKAGNMTFEWDGRKYGTRRADENKEQHAAAMKKASGSSSEAEATPTTPTAGTTPPGSTRNETPARTTRTGGSGMGANEREEALRAEIDSAKPKAEAKPAPKKRSYTNDMLSMSEFQSAKGAAESPGSAANIAKFYGATSPKDGAAKRNKRDAAAVKAEAKKVASKRSSLADRRVAKKEAKDSKSVARANRQNDRGLKRAERKSEFPMKDKATKKAVSAKSATKKIIDKVNRQAPRKDRKIERVAAKNERQNKRLDRKAARYDRKIDPNTGISKREMNKGARKAKRANASAAVSKRAMGDAVERDLKAKGIMQAAGRYRKR